VNETLNRASQVFRKLLIVNMSILFSMSLQRAILFFLIIRHWVFGADAGAIASSFLAGFRFDLCVLGFLNIPVLFITWIICSDKVAKSQAEPLSFLRRWVLWIYFGITTFVIHLLGVLDMMYFAANGRRWTYFDWQREGLQFVSSVAQKWGAFYTTCVITLFLVLWVVRCLYGLYRARLHQLPVVGPTKPPFSTGTLILTGVLGPFFVVATAARGTWTAHHINQEHAQVSQNPVLNQLALNPVWAFDKKF